MRALSPISTRPSVVVRWSRGCPRCDGEEIGALPPLCVDSELVWHECQDCGHLWALPHALGSRDIAEGAR
jgi:hypothetical protein